MTVDPERLRQTSRHNALVNPGAAYQLREAADEIERLVAEVEQSHTEIDRMRALLDQATQSANSTVRALVAADAREATLRALLTEARDVLRGSATFAQVGEHLELIEGWESESDAVLTTKVVAALAVWKSLADSLSGRIDAALGGGAPCATCNGTGKVERWYVHSNSTSGGKPCPDCSGVAS